MFSTINMGIGMMMFVVEKDAEGVVAAIKAAGEDAYIIGKTVERKEEEVILNL